MGGPTVCVSGDDIVSNEFGTNRMLWSLGQSLMCFTFWGQALMYLLFFGQALMCLRTHE
jgi:hypothetical protein